MTTKRHIMIDLETLGTFMNAPVITIGACFFNPMTGEIGDTFYERIDIAEAMKYGRADPETLRWWLTQNPDAQKELAKKGNPAAEVLEAFKAFYKKSQDGQVWGNGPTFDITMLDYQFDRVLGEKAPWPFWNVRCVRTVVEMAEGIVKRPAHYTRKDVVHSALDDCIFQVEYVSKMWRALIGPATGQDLSKLAATVAHSPAADEDDDFL